MTKPEPRDPRVDTAYRDAATDAPRAEIDDRIRAAARRAVAAGPQPLEGRARAEAQRSWIARWRVPVSIAATVVVAVTLAYMMEREETRLARTDGVPAGAPPSGVPTQAGKVQTPAPAAASPVAAAPHSAPRPEPVPTRRVDEEMARPSAERKAAQNAPAAQALHQGPVAAERTAPAPAPPRAPSIEREQRQAVGEVRPAPSVQEPAASVPVPAPASAFPAAPAPAPAAKPAPLAAREAAGVAARDRAFADRPERMERQAQPTEQKVRTPEEWLEDLRRLKTQQRTDDFARELAEFRKRYPDFKLPADLQP